MLLPVVLVLTASPALALRFADVSGTTTGTQSYPQVTSGSATAAPVTGTWTQSGTYLTSPTTDPWPWTDSTSANYNGTIVVPVTGGTPVARAVSVVGTGCASASTSPVCTDRGAITLTFSRAMTNPMLYLAGMGGNDGTLYQFAPTLDIASALNDGAPATVTFASPYSTNSSSATATIEVVNGGTRLQTVATRPGTECNSTGTGATSTVGPAAAPSC